MEAIAYNLALNSSYYIAIVYVNVCVSGGRMETMQSLDREGEKSMTFWPLIYGH